MKLKKYFKKKYFLTTFSIALTTKMDFSHEDFDVEFSFKNIVLFCSTKTAEDDMEYNRQELVICLCNRKCGHFLYDAIADLDWILKSQDDNELCSWACEHFAENSRETETKHILCHSPKDAAIQILLDTAYTDCEFCFCNFRV